MCVYIHIVCVYTYTHVCILVIEEEFNVCILVIEEEFNVLKENAFRKKFILINKGLNNKIFHAGRWLDLCVSPNSSVEPETPFITPHHGHG